MHTTTGARRNGHPLGADTGTDTGTDTGADTGTNTGADTGTNTGEYLGVDTDSDTDDTQSGTPHPLGFRANTRTPDPDGYLDERTLPQRQADALGELCGFALRHDNTLPDNGGERPQIRVTLDLERLRAAVAGTHLDTGAWYSPSQLRMLACDAFVIPAILDGKSEPLDIGRAARTIPTAIRRAVAIRDGGCSFPGCNRPPAWQCP